MLPGRISTPLIFMGVPSMEKSRKRFDAKAQTAGLSVSRAIWQSGMALAAAAMLARLRWRA
jgi:hypothetical protein